MPIDVHAEINPQDRIDEIWNAWAKMDGEASIRDIVRRAVEQKAGAKHRRFEALELKKKKRTRRDVGAGHAGGPPLRDCGEPGRMSKCSVSGRAWPSQVPGVQCLG